MNNVYIKHYADEDSLTHYGVKGMKWRKHKARRDWEDDTSISERFKQYGIDSNDPERIDRLVTSERLFEKGIINRKEGRLKARRSITKTLSSVGKTSISKAKKAISKGKSLLPTTYNRQVKKWPFKSTFRRGVGPIYSEAINRQLSRDRQISEAGRNLDSVRRKMVGIPPGKATSYSVNPKYYKMKKR